MELLASNLESKAADIAWNAENLCPMVVQDILTGQILMLGYCNRESLQRTFDSKTVWFYSRSRNRLWQKGETSGNTLLVHNVFLDCDSDTILVHATPNGPTCHTGTRTCFDTHDNQTVGPTLRVLGDLQVSIADRARGTDPESYSFKLLQSGIDKILKKIGEESAETIVAAKNLQANPSDSILRDEYCGESADLLFHWMMTNQALGIELSDVMAVLQKRVGAPRRK